ncbi:MAG: hypothetical protein A2017_08590 [Lentisphaerae bacterium GWF2_44_16]|nr:MAG: hypothetical protein A2017_08590 [Lentisphaerae bacterium GWF2_44_16]
MIFSKQLDKFLSLSAGIAFPLFRKALDKKFESDFKSFGVESTNVCNAKCSFCAYRLGYDGREKGFVNEDVLRHSLKLFKKHGGSNFSFISVLGDPLTDKDLISKIKIIAAEPQIKEINIYSNMIGLDRYDIDEFVTSGVTIISVSTCLGGREMYKKLFGVDEYERAMKNILTLLEANRKHGNPLKITLLIRMYYPVEKNYDREILEKIREYLPKNNIDVLPYDMWDDYNGKIKLPDIPEGGKFKHNLRDKKSPCYALYRKVQVLYNGDIAVCSCRVSPELVTDNIFKYEDLFDYWHGKSLAKIRNEWKKGNIPKICRGCNHYQTFDDMEKLALKEMFRAKIKKLFPR